MIKLNHPNSKNDCSLDFGGDRKRSYPAEVLGATILSLRSKSREASRPGDPEEPGFKVETPRRPRAGSSPAGCMEATARLLSRRLLKSTTARDLCNRALWRMWRRTWLPGAVYGWGKPPLRDILRNTTRGAAATLDHGPSGPARKCKTIPPTPTPGWPRPARPGCTCAILGQGSQVGRGVPDYITSKPPPPRPDPAPFYPKAHSHNYCPRFPSDCTHHHCSGREPEPIWCR